MAHLGSITQVARGVITLLVACTGCASTDGNDGDSKDVVAAGGAAGTAGVSGGGASNGGTSNGGSVSNGGRYHTGLECLGSGRYECRDGVVSHTLFGGGYPDGTQCTVVDYRCKKECIPDFSGDEAAPEMLCSEYGQPSEGDGGTGDGGTGDGGVPP